ncbi:glycosyltransferase [Lysinibacillus sp. NPDC096212]|uniref:glycosyltransferase n=1 Tax=Lysinibacillus sp. NPDC096212 TaxID=3364135 RepID=UPI003816A610
MKKILIFDRINSSKFPGGDTVQINAIKDFLISHNYNVTISDNPLENLSEHDYVFIFNLTNPLEAYVCMKACERYNKPYILFPVYWNLDSLKMPFQFNVKSIAKKVLPGFLKSFVRASRFFKMNTEIVQSLKITKTELFNIEKCIKCILKNAYYICPNSFAELDHLEDNFNLSSLNKKIKIIYNGIDLKKLDAINQDDAIKLKYNLPEDYICCVGGIGPRKNQLNLVKAANRTEVNIVIIGKPTQGYEAYFENVKKIAKDNVYFLSHLPQDEVFKIIKSSKGHIQPSFIETPGLASLEAVVLGIPIILSDTKPVAEYFGTDGLYCNPRAIKEIELNLKKLYRGEGIIGVSVKKYRERFRWDAVLQDIIDLLK